MKEFTDFLGKPVDVGDFIFYSTTGRYAESRVCRITRFTEKTVFAEIIKCNRPHCQIGKEVRVENSFVKLKIV